MEFETLYTLGKIAGAIVSIGGAVKYFPMGYRWIRSWKIVRQKEFARLKAIEAEHQKCEAEKERRSKIDTRAIARGVREYLQKPPVPEVKVDTEFSVFDSFKVRR